MGMLERQAVVTQQRAAPLLRLEAGEQPVDAVLVADDAVGALSARPGLEGQRGDAEHQRELGFLQPRLRLDVVRRQHPCGVGALLHGPSRQPALGRRPDPVAHVAAPHQIRDVHRRRLAALEAREMDVLGGGDDAPAAARGDLDAPLPLRHRRVGHARGPEVAAAIGRQHFVPHPDGLDRLDRAVAHRDRRPLDEALVVVADDRDVAVLRAQELEPAVLGVVGVLVLVDEDPAEGGRVAVADLLEELEQVDRADEEVVEVHRVHAVELALVLLVDVGDRLLEVGADELAVVLGRAELVLRVRDLGLHRAGGEALGVDVEVVEAALDQAPLVGRVVDRELARVAEPVGVGAQHPRAGGVERHHPHRAGGAADEQLDPLAHLLRRLVGERDREDLVRARLLGAHQVGDAVGEHARLARAGAREDQQRPLAVHDGVSLGRVETRQQLVDPRVLGRLGHADPRYRAGRIPRRRQRRLGSDRAPTRAFRRSRGPGEVRDRRSAPRRCVSSIYASRSAPRSTKHTEPPPPQPQLTSAPLYHRPLAAGGAGHHRGGSGDHRPGGGA